MCQRPNAFNTTAHSDEDRQDLHDATLVGDDIEQDMVLDFLHNLDNPARTQINVNFETQSGMTPLILACILNQHVDRVLAEPTLDINYKNAYDCSALMAACEANQLEVVQKLLAHPAIDLGDLNASFCMACKGGHDSVVDYLLSTYPDIDLNYGMTTEVDQIEHISGLELAIMNGHEKVVLSVLKQCFSTDYAKFNATLHVRASALSKACQVGNVNIAKLILATGNFDSIHLSDGMNEACSNGHLPIVQLLVDDYEVDINYGEPLDALDSDDPDMFPLGVTPFYLACQSNHKVIVQYLLTLPCLDPRQLCSALNAAPDMDIVDVLLSHPKLNINDTVGDLPPLTIACVDGHLPKLARLLAVPDIDNDTTAFMIACSKGSVDAVKLFLGHPELDLSAVNQHGADVLSIASDAGHADVVSLLLEHAHFDAKEVRGEALGVACAHGRIDVVKLLVACPAMNANHVELGLFLACQGGHHTIVRFLLETSPHAVNVNALMAIPGQESATCLIVACGHGHDRVVAVLLEHPSIELNVVQGTPYVPLVQACSFGHFEVVKLLLGHPKIDVHCKGAGTTAMAAAQAGKHVTVQAILRQHVAPKCREPPQKRQKPTSPPASHPTKP